jgi:hypothetical protein
MGQAPHRIEVRHLDGRQHQVRDTRRHGALHHGCAIGIEFGRVQVAVRVDPHGAMMAQLCGAGDAVAPAT